MQRIGVVGCGLMGAGIAEVAAKAGTDVTVCDINEAAVGAGRARIEASLARFAAIGELPADDVLLTEGPPLRICAVQVEGCTSP